MPVIRNRNQIPLEEVSAGSKTQRQALTERGSGAGFHMRRFVMGPGGGMPRHTNAVEHQQYVLRGGAEVGIGDETHQVTAGDVVHIPAGVPHWYDADEDEGFEFLCVVPDDQDRIELVDE